MIIFSFINLFILIFIDIWLFVNINALCVFLDLQKDLFILLPLAKLFVLSGVVFDIYIYMIFVVFLFVYILCNLYLLQYCLFSQIKRKIQIIMIINSLFSSNEISTKVILLEVMSLLKHLISNKKWLCVWSQVWSEYDEFF